MTATYKPKLPVTDKIKNLYPKLKWKTIDDDGPYLDDPDGFILEYKGTLYIPSEDRSESNDPAKGEVIGQINCYKINVHQLRQCRQSVSGALDDHSSVLDDIGSLWTQLANEEDYSAAGSALRHRLGGSLRRGRGPNIRNEVGGYAEITQGDLVWIEHVEVVEKYRGFGLGLFMVHRAVHSLNSYKSLTVLKPEAHLNWMPKPKPSSTLSSLPQVKKEENDPSVKLEAKDDEAEEDEEDEGPKLTSAEEAVATVKLTMYFALLGFRRLGDDYLGVWNGNRLPFIRTVCPFLGIMGPGHGSRTHYTEDDGEFNAGVFDGDASDDSDDFSFEGSDSDDSS